MLTETARTFCAQQSNANTTAAYLQDLTHWFKFLGKREPTRDIAIEWRKHLESAGSQRTAARRFNTARSYYRWDGTGSNPFDSIKSPRRLRNATPIVPLDSVVDMLLSGADTPRDAAIISLLLNGLRASEVCSLKPDDFQWSPLYGCHIIKVLGKGGKERLVPANSQTSQRVSAYQSISKRGSDRLIRALRGSEPMTRRQVTEALRRASKRAGIPDVNPHALRHWYATHLVRSKANVFAVQRLLGHESLATTMVYVTLDLGDLVGEARKGERSVDRKENEIENYADNAATGRNPYQGSDGAERVVPTVH